MNNLVKQSMAGLRVLLVLTVITGVLYPLAVWGVSRIPGLQANAEGSVIRQDGHAVGSSLIGIDPIAADPAHDPWFHTRPSAATLPASGGSNKSGDNPDYLVVVGERKKTIAQREDVTPARVPADAVTASGSGLDPHISPTYAGLQVARVARENGMAEDNVRELVQRYTSRGIGEPVVNVPELNLAVQGAH